MLIEMGSALSHIACSCLSAVPLLCDGLTGDAGGRDLGAASDGRGDALGRFLRR
jgi:hypothetical protein